MPSALGALSRDTLVELLLREPSSPRGAAPAAAPPRKPPNTARPQSQMAPHRQPLHTPFLLSEAVMSRMLLNGAELGMGGGHAAASRAYSLADELAEVATRRLAPADVARLRDRLTTHLLSLAMTRQEACSAAAVASERLLDQLRSGRNVATTPDDVSALCSAIFTWDPATKHAFVSELCAMAAAGQAVAERAVAAHVEGGAPLSDRPRREEHFPPLGTDGGRLAIFGVADGSRQSRPCSTVTAGAAG